MLDEIYVVERRNKQMRSKYKDINNIYIYIYIYIYIDLIDGV